MSSIQQVREGIIFTAKIKPNSRKFKIEKDTIYCKSPPEDNKANMEIIKELERLTSQQVRIIRGLTSKKKRILIHNITENEFNELIK